MPRKRYQVEEIIQKLRAAEVLLSQGKNVAEACRQGGGVPARRDRHLERSDSPLAVR